MPVFLKKKTEANMFDLLLAQFKLTMDGLEELHKYCKTNDFSHGEKCLLIEKEGDKARRILIDEITNTFITPIDREDLFDLSRLVDDVLDYAQTTVDEMGLFNIEPDSAICEMVEKLFEMTQLLYSSACNIEKRKAIAAEDALKAKKIENVVGAICNKSLAKLFDTQDFRNIFKYREIYRHINRAADAADRCADLIMNITVKL